MSLKKTRLKRQAMCEHIVNNIVHRCKERYAGGEDGFAIAFGPDAWGGNSLTIYDGDGAHTHVGMYDTPDDQLIEQLHNLLVGGRGLSWV